MPRPWLDLDTALALVGCDRQELTRACRVRDVNWRALDASGAVLKPPDDRWTGEVDWTAHPPRFGMADPYQLMILGGSPAKVGQLRWHVAEVTRKSLLAHFAEPEPLAVRVTDPVSIQTIACKPSGRPATSAEIERTFDEFVERSPRRPTRDECRTECKRVGLPACSWDDLLVLKCPGNRGPRPRK